MIMAAAPAFAQTIPAQAPKAQPVASTDKSDANRIVCKTEKVIGTRLGGKKVCLTVKEWQERASVGREETDRVQRDSQLGTPSG
ncbi:MAG TPA: hypothetical protein VMK31_05765 [Sphingomicrobium sp.]|nr:hypothetical protein [Sphingomicrobium sp.]